MELALFGGVGAVAYAAVGHGAAAWAAAAVRTALVLVLWGLFMAPRGRARLAAGPRAAVAVVLVYSVAFGLLRAGHTGWAWCVGIAGLALVAGQVALPERTPPAGS